ncbi:MAG: serine/threonine-protein phosphatase [Clostridium sp.]|nr:serine/threonine-protein phosphatase [Clostridium sp.]
MDTSQKKYPHRISRKILLICTLLVIMLCVSITYFSMKRYRDDLYQSYQNYESALLKIAASESDVDGILKAIKTGDKNAAYKDMSKRFNQYLETTSLRYLYAIYLTENDELRYVVNGYRKGAKPEDIHELNDEPLPGDFKSVIMNSIHEVYKSKKNTCRYQQDVDVNNEQLLTGIYPLRNEDGEIVCVIGADISIDRIHKNEQAFLIGISIWVMALGCIFLVILVLVMRKNIIIPLKGLASSAKNFITQQENGKPGKLHFNEVCIHTGDEMEMLADSLAFMVQQIQDYTTSATEYAAKQERVNAQFKVVEQLKENLFPFRFPAFRERTDFSIHAKIAYSKRNSGDFYNFFLIDPTHLCFFTGTASGTGISTTMVAIITTIYMENYARLGYMPARILRETNNRLSENNSSEITVNTFLGMVDLKTGEFTYAKVGETAPCIKRSGQDAQILACTKGFPLGELKNVNYAQQTCYLKQGEAVLLYTAGVAAQKDEKGYEYLDESVKELWNTYMKKEYSLPLIIEGMYGEFSEFAKGVPIEQDQTLLCFRYNG